MKPTFVVFALLVLAACSDVAQDEGAISTTVTSASIASRGGREFRKTGTILAHESSSIDTNKIIMWDTYLGAKKPLYQFKPGEAVVVYGKVGEYVYLCPAKDTALLGYILAGWVEFKPGNKANNDVEIASLPELRHAAKAIEQREIQPSNNWRGRRQIKSTKQASDTIHRDDKHMLQEDDIPEVSIDSIPLFFEDDKDTSGIITQGRQLLP